MRHSHHTRWNDYWVYVEQEARIERFWGEIEDRKRFEELYPQECEVDMDTSKYYQTESKFLKSENLMAKDGKRYVEIKVMIADVAQEELHDDAGEVKVQLSIGFEERSKRMLLNKTNYQVLASAYGTDSDDWIGKELILYVDPYVRFKDKTVPGLRLRPVTPQVEGEDVPF